MIHIGTSGYSYDDWKGVFYPDHLPQDGFLSFYSKHFNAVELNFSYYRMPSANQLEKMISTTDGKMLFAIKAHQSFTHQRTASSLEIKQFSDAISPVASAGCLGAVLLQFPHSFSQNETNRAYLSHLSDKLKFPLVAEFRNAEWVSRPVFNWLKKINVGYCCVDEPNLPGLMPPIHVATSPIAYVRFHGRNSAKWYTHNHAYERYDYKYTANELRQWLAPLENLSRSSMRTLVFFNNHFQAKAVDSAKQLSHMLQHWKEMKRKE